MLSLFLLLSFNIDMQIIQKHDCIISPLKIEIYELSDVIQNGFDLDELNLEDDYNLEFEEIEWSHESI